MKTLIVAIIIIVNSRKVNNYGDFNDGDFNVDDDVGYNVVCIIIRD